MTAEPSGSVLSAPAGQPTEGASSPAQHIGADRATADDGTKEPSPARGPENPVKGQAAQ